MNPKTFFAVITMMVSAGHVVGQSCDERAVSPACWRRILDPSFHGGIAVDTIGFGDIPVDVEYRGTVVEAIQWTHSSSRHMVFLTQTGDFKRTDDAGDPVDRAELHAYHLLQETGGKWQRLWRISDFNECPELDQYVGFIQGSLTITDLDQNGEPEVTLGYRLLCRGGLDPGTMKLILYEGLNKRAVRGTATICIPNAEYPPSTPTPDKEATSHPLFLDHLMKQWKRFECEDAGQLR